MRLIKTRTALAHFHPSRLHRFLLSLFLLDDRLYRGRGCTDFELAEVFVVGAKKVDHLKTSASVRNSAISATMRLQFAFLLVVLCVHFASTTRFLDQLSKQGSQLISQSRIPHKTIRQCSCKENNDCVSQMKEQAVDCINTCWTKAGTLTEKPQMLKECFIGKRYIVDQFIDCIQDKMNTCVPTDEGPQIPYTDIHQLIRLGEQKIESQVESIKKTLGGAGGNDDILIDTALDIADCVKECFVSKNANGFCFDRMNCQPLIKEDNNARRSLKFCMRTVGWKKEASELCECAVNAGVSEMNQYCAMLRTISGGRRPINDK